MNISDTQKVNPLVIWALADDKPGHANQTEGLVKALSSYRQTKIIRPSLVALSQAIKMWLLKRCDRSLNQDYPDLIIGTGHKTHLSLLAYKKCYGGKSVVIMGPSLPCSFFDLCLIPRHDNPSKKENIIETLGAINLVVPDDSSQIENTGLILLGGPSKHYQWDSKKIIKQLQKLLKEKPYTKWIIAGSRRTPLTTYDEIEGNFRDVSLVLPQDVSPDWLPKKALQSEDIWVTADSISMIYEALTSGAKTGILKLDFDKASRITREMDRLLSEGIVISLETLEQISTASSIYEADRCAKLLLEKFEL